MYSNYNYNYTNNKINNLQSSQTNSEQIITKPKLYLTNIFIIDWDDTLFPTTWVNTNKINMSDVNSVKDYKLYFLELDKKK